MPTSGLVLAREGGTFRVATAEGEVAAVLRTKRPGVAVEIVKELEIRISTDLPP